jgi:hypothetical protein
MKCKFKLFFYQLGPSSRTVLVTRVPCIVYANKLIIAFLDGTNIKCLEFQAEPNHDENYHFITQEINE